MLKESGAESCGVLPFDRLSESMSDAMRKKTAQRMSLGKDGFSASSLLTAKKAMEILPLSRGDGITILLSKNILKASV